MLALYQPHAASPEALPAELPLQSRIWHLFCQGYSYTAIGAQLGLERHTVARHVRAVETLLAEEHADDLALARHRALEAAYSLLAITLEHLDAESHREDAVWREYEQALAGVPTVQSACALEPVASSFDASPPPVPVKQYRAGHSRLLGIALAALRHAIRLSGLDEGAAGGSLSLPALPPCPPPPDPVSPATGLAAPSAPSTSSAPSEPRLATTLVPTLQEAGDKPASHTASSSPATDAAFTPATPVERATDLSVLATGRGAASAPVIRDTPNSGTKWNMPARSNRGADHTADHGARSPARTSRTPTLRRKKPRRR